MISYANENLCKNMKNRGGGVTDIHLVRENYDNIWIVYVMIDVRDAMGANTVNTVLEGLSKKM